MTLLQLSGSKEYGSYFYDPSDASIFHLSTAEMVEISGLKKVDIVACIMGISAAIMGVITYIEGAQYVWQYNSTTYLLLAFVTVLSAGASYWHTIKTSQHYDREIRRTKQPVSMPSGHLLAEIKRGVAPILFYVGIGLVSFVAMVVALCVFWKTHSLPAIIFCIFFLDMLIMSTFSLRPIERYNIYQTLKNSERQS